MKMKTFDCVEMMHKGQERIQKELEGMTVQEQLEYWRKITEEMRKSQAQARRKGKDLSRVGKAL